MTRRSPNKEESSSAVSSDAILLSSGFPDYKLGPDGQIMEMNEDPMKEAVAREVIQLLEQHKRLSVRELALRFEKGLAAASKLSAQAKLKDTASLEKHVLLKKLRDSLESLRGRVSGQTKHDSDEAIAMVEALAYQLAQREGELIQEKDEVKKLAGFLKQASEDAMKLVEEERSMALAEIENARSAVLRVEAASAIQQSSPGSGNQDYEELVKEVQEARRIKMLHQPSKVMDMEHELAALRALLLEKSKHTLLLQKELAMTKKGEDDASLYYDYEIEGQEILGSCLCIRKRTSEAAHLSDVSVQWSRVSPHTHNSDTAQYQLISGATKSVYAPEPFDVGSVLQAEISFDGHKITVSTTGPIEPAPGLGSYVESLLRRNDMEFNVVVTQTNGIDQTSSQSIHALHIGKMRMKLRKGKTTVTKENYSASMQLCGVRGGGNAASQALFWQPKPGLSFILAFESPRDRNTAIRLARRFAFDCCNITLAGPGDTTALGN